MTYDLRRYKQHTQLANAAYLKENPTFNEEQQKPTIEATQAQESRGCVILPAL